MTRPAGRLGKSYRIMWCDDSGAGAGRYNPPITPEKLAQLSFGQLEGTPVRAGSSNSSKPSQSRIP